MMKMKTLNMMYLDVNDLLEWHCKDTFQKMG